jgi:hypothetical protein
LVFKFAKCFEQHYIGGIFGPRTLVAIGPFHGISKPRTTTKAIALSLAKTSLASPPPSLTRTIESTTIARC